MRAPAGGGLEPLGARSGLRLAVPHACFAVSNRGCRGYSPAPGGLGRAADRRGRRSGNGGPPPAPSGTRTSRSWSGGARPRVAFDAPRGQRLLAVGADQHRLEFVAAGGVGQQERGPVGGGVAVSPAQQKCPKRKWSPSRTVSPPPMPTLARLIRHWPSELCDRMCYPTSSSWSSSSSSSSSSSRASRMASGSRFRSCSSSASSSSRRVGSCSASMASLTHRSTYSANVPTSTCVTCCESAHKNTNSQWMD